MKIRTLLIAAIALACGTAVSAQKTSQEYLEAFTGGRFTPARPAAIYQMNDGKHYTVLSEDGKRIVKYEYKSGKEVGTIVNLERLDDCPIKEIKGYAFDNQEQKLLLNTEKTPIYRRSYTTTYYVYYIERKHIEPLSDKGERQRDAQFSPDGRMVAFSRDNNLYIKKLNFGTEIAVTKDGETNKIINGTADWVYEEEFAETRYFAWSPDSKLLAYVRFDESAVEQFSFTEFEAPYTSEYTYKYPKAGTTNSTVSLHVYDCENRTTKKMDAGEGNDIYFPILRWTRSNESVAVVRLNRNQTELDLLSVNPRSGVATKLMSEKDKVYADYTNLTALHFNSDNSFICMSERDGYRHLYLFNANGTMSRQITKGEWDVTDFYGYNEKTKTAYFQAAKENPTERHVYSADAKGKISCFDTRPGTHSATFTKDMKMAVTQFNNTETPNIYTLTDAKGKAIRTIEDNSRLVAYADSFNLPKKEFITFTTEEGITLNGWIVKPTDMEDGRRYPLVMVQYSGPNSQEALNRWKPDWEYYLAQEGYAVACVDGRGTGARGREFRTCTYWHLGRYETADQVAAAKYFGTLPYIDPERICIWGWSYGGFMALNCLTFGDGTFKAGISVAPVTDWRLYNTAYTERFMSRPQDNPEGYEEHDLIKHAGELEGKLLLVHGSADDNVHFQQSMLYVEQLVEAGKQFEMQVYPNKNHSILGKKTRLHLYTRFNEFLKRNL